MEQLYMEEGELGMKPNGTWFEHVGLCRFPVQLISPL
jgi:hypothetical protein